MTVKELKTLLSEYDDSMEVMVYANSDGYVREIYGHSDFDSSERPSDYDECDDDEYDDDEYDDDEYEEDDEEYCPLEDCYGNEIVEDKLLLHIEQ